jgi:uncharacterized protein YndB with AHSA1/START domain
MTSRFVYVTYIRTTPEKLWEAIVNPEFSRHYWLGAEFKTDWHRGAPWTLTLSDGTLADTGEILEFEPPKRFVLKWRNEMRPELGAEGFSRCTFEIDRDGEVMRLTVTHEIERDGSKLIEAVSGGWPRILSGLKTWLETGAELGATKVARAKSAA